jgi:hypothetical protein
MKKDLVFTLLAIAGCTALTSTAIGADGQLFCAVAGQTIGVIDATTGKNYVVTNKAASTVASVCSLVAPGSFPVVPPVTVVPSVAVIPPTVS